jgi:hypothetical protein
MIKVLIINDEQSDLAMIGRIVLSLEPLPVRARRQLSAWHRVVAGVRCSRGFAAASAVSAVATRQKDFMVMVMVMVLRRHNSAWMRVFI